MAFLNKGQKKHAPVPDSQEPEHVSPEMPSDEEFELMTPEEQAALSQMHFDREAARLAEESDSRLNRKDRTNQILTHRCIDPHEGPLATWIHKWVDITPSICTEPDCGFDLAVEMGFKNGWDSIPEKLMHPLYPNQTVRDRAIKLLEQHKAIDHPSVRPKHIRSKEQADRDRYERQHKLPDGFVTNPALSRRG